MSEWHAYQGHTHECRIFYLLVASMRLKVWSLDFLEGLGVILRGQYGSQGNDKLSLSFFFQFIVYRR